MLRGGVGSVMKLTGWGGVGGSCYSQGVGWVMQWWGGSCSGGVGHAVKQHKKMLVLRIKI